MLKKRATMTKQLRLSTETVCRLQRLPDDLLKNVVGGRITTSASCIDTLDCAAK